MYDEGMLYWVVNFRPLVLVICEQELQHSFYSKFEFDEHLHEEESIRKLVWFDSVDYVLQCGEVFF